jgi:hypothetical protein
LKIRVDIHFAFNLCIVYLAEDLALPQPLKMVKLISLSDVRSYEGMNKIGRVSPLSKILLPLGTVIFW